MQNETLFKQYLLHRNEVAKRAKKKTDDVDNWLWHGTDEKAVASIESKGFNRSFAGVKGLCLFGKHLVKYYFN